MVCSMYYAGQVQKMNVRELSPALRSKAEQEINETPDKVASHIKLLKEWLRTQPNTEYLRPTDQWILAFLRGSKFNIEKSKQKLTMYYDLKNYAPEYYGNRDPFSEEIQELLKLGAFLPTRKLKEEDASRVCLSRVGLLDPSKHRLVTFNKIAFMMIEILLLEDDNMSVVGQETLVDMNKMKISILGQWTPSLAKKTVTCFTKAIPLRIKGLHIMNTITGFETAYAILKIFLPEKLKKRFHVYSKGNKALFKVASKDILPVEYGGEAGTIEELRDYWKAKVESYRDWFVEGDTLRIEEMTNKKALEADMWTERSFRELEVD